MPEEENKELAINIQFEGDLLSVFSLIRTRYFPYQASNLKFLALAEFNREEGCLPSI